MSDGAEDVPWCLAWNGHSEMAKRADVGGTVLPGRYHEMTSHLFQHLASCKEHLPALKSTIPG
jgi:hypothetical protein